MSAGQYRIEKRSLSALKRPLRGCVSGGSAELGEKFTAPLAKREIIEPTWLIAGRPMANNGDAGVARRRAVGAGFYER